MCPILGTHVVLHRQSFERMPAPDQICVSFVKERVRLTSAGETREVSEAEHLRWVLDGARFEQMRAQAPEVVSEDRGPKPLPLVFGEYYLLAPIGRGCFGEVFAAWDPVCRERVAVKVLHRSDAWSLQDFKNEFRRLVNLHEEGLCAPEELVCADTRAALVMRLIAGREIDSVFAEAGGQRGAIADSERLRGLVVSFATALAHLHSGGLMHMDLKPGNVLVNADDQVLLLDFGLSRLRRQVSAGANISGSPLYMAPEQLLRKAPTPAVDLYALGVLLFTALTGVHPFEGAVPDRVFARLYEPAPSLAKRRPGVEKLWSQIVDGLLEHTPERRLGVSTLLRLLDAERPQVVAARTLVGRSRELEVLHACWEQVCDAVPSLVLVAGEPGVGKSELVRSFCDELRADHAVVWGPCYESESFPYKTVDVLVEGLVGLIEGDEERRSEVRKLPGIERLAQVAPALAFVSAGVPVAELGDAALGCRGEAFAALVSLVAERTPLCLVIDDAQWGDADSADLLAPLLTSPNLRRVMIVFSHRTRVWEMSPFGRALESQIAKGLPCALTRLELQVLASSEAESWLRSRLPPEIDEQQRAQALSRAKGRPDLLAAYARLLVEGRGVPGEQDLLEHWLADLGSDVRCFVDTVAIAGAPIELSAVIRASGRDAPSRRVLRFLRWRRVLMFDHRGGRRRISIAHSRMQETLLERVGPQSLRACYSDLADVLLFDGAREPARIAHYLHRAGRLAEAEELGRRGAAEAEKAGAFTQVADSLRLVLYTGCSDPEERARVEERRAQALAAAGRGLEAGEIYLQLAGERASPVESRELRRHAVEAWLTGGEVERGLQVLGPLLRELRLPRLRRGRRGFLRAAMLVLRLILGARRLQLSPVEDPRAGERADTCWVGIKGLIFVDTGLAMPLMIDGLVAAAQSGSRLRFGRAMGLVAAMLGDLPGLRGSTADWLDTIETWSPEEPYLAATLPLWRSIRAQAQGDLICAREHGLLALERLAAIKDASWERVQAASCAARALRNQGEFVACAELSRAQLRSAERRGDRYAQALFRLLPIQPVIARGGLGEARTALRWISEHWMRGSYTVQSFYIMVERGYADLYEGNPRAAASRWLAGRWAYRRSGAHLISFSRIERRILEGRIGLALGVRDGGLMAVEKIVAKLRGEGTLEALGNSELMDAALAAGTGESKRAEAALHRAIDAFSAAGILMEREAARFRLAELCGDAEEARDAQAQMRRLGAGSPERWAQVIAPGFAARHSG